MSEPRVYGHEYEFKDNQAWDFEATFDAEGFAAVIESAAPLVDTAPVDIDAESVSISTFDPAKVAGIEVERPCVRETDGILTADLDIRTMERNWPGYWPGGDDAYTLAVSHGNGEHSAELRHATEGRQSIDVRPPDTHRQLEEWPDADADREVNLTGPKAKGVFTGIANAASKTVRIQSLGDKLVFEADDASGDWAHSWLVDVSCGPVVGPQVYSADYLRQIAAGLWPTPEYTVRFGPEQPLQIETDGLRFIQAPRVDS